MLQDIAPHIYHNPMSFVPPAPGDLALAYAGGQVLARLEEGLLQLPRVEQCTGASGWIYGFSIDETHYYLPQGPALQAPGFSMVSNYRALAPGQTVFACAVERASPGGMPETGSAAPAAGLWSPAPWNGPWFAPPVAALSTLKLARL